MNTPAVLLCHSHPISDSVYYFGNALCFIPCSEGGGKPQVISPYKDPNGCKHILSEEIVKFDTYSSFFSSPSTVGSTQPDDWSRSWQSTETQRGEKPHHGQSLRLDSSYNCALILPFVSSAPPFGNQITVFLQVQMRETAYNRGQQDIISLWYADQRLTLEYHPDSGLGLCKKEVSSLLLAHTIL
jgi:hypothetical protein